MGPFLLARRRSRVGPRPAAGREPGTRTWGGGRAVCGRLVDQRWLGARFLGAGAERGLGEELGEVRRRTRCAITGCAGSGAGGSWDRPAEPRYPGAADCFFAQEPVEERGVSGTTQRDPNGAGQGLGGSPPPCSHGGMSPMPPDTPKPPQPTAFHTAGFEEVPGGGSPGFNAKLPN